MQPEPFGTEIPGAAIPLDQLIPGAAVLGFFRISDDRISVPERAGIVPEADQIRNGPESLMEIVEMGKIIEIDDGTKPNRCGKLVERCIVGCKHD